MAVTSWMQSSGSMIASTALPRLVTIQYRPTITAGAYAADTLLGAVATQTDQLYAWALAGNIRALSLVDGDRNYAGGNGAFDIVVAANTTGWVSTANGGGFGLPVTGGTILWTKRVDNSDWRDANAGGGVAAVAVLDNLSMPFMLAANTFYVAVVCRQAPTFSNTAAFKLDIIIERADA